MSNREEGDNKPLWGVWYIGTRNENKESVSILISHGMESII